jgi:hypothetical protein
VSPNPRQSLGGIFSFLNSERAINGAVPLPAYSGFLTLIQAFDGPEGDVSRFWHYSLKAELGDGRVNFRAIPHGMVNALNSSARPAEVSISIPSCVRSAVAVRYHARKKKIESRRLRDSHRLCGCAERRNPQRPWSINNDLGIDNHWLTKQCGFRNHNNPRLAFGPIIPIHIVESRTRPSR